MLAEDRQSRILALVNRQKSVKLTELCEALDMSESTARRDLKELAARNLLIKVHGGAIAKDDSFLNTEADVEEKSHLNMEEKEKIARYAASLIEDGDCVFLDAGTTTGAMVDFIQAKDVLFVTNGMVHALKLAQNGQKVMVTGGNVKASTEALVGTECIKSCERFYFSKSFLGCNGISMTRGVTTPDSMEATIKEVVIKNSANAYVLADHTKFDAITTVKFADLSRVTVITDQAAGEKYQQNGSIIVVTQGAEKVHEI